MSEPAAPNSTSSKRMSSFDVSREDIDAYQLSPTVSPDDRDQMVRENFPQFNDASHQFESELIDAKKYKEISTSFGEYVQRNDLQMLRIRVPGGRLTLSHAKVIIDCCHYYGIDQLKISTGQALQLHDVEPHAGRRLILRLHDAGIETFGAGGDNPNNVTASPLSGVDDGYFDVQPYAEVADRFLVQYFGISPLPRKFKIGFADGPANETHVSFKDLGYMANPDGTFDVYAIGGMGFKPLPGILVAEHIDPRKTLYYLRTMLDLFIQYGNYKQHLRARSRFLQQTMGIDKFRELFDQHLSEVMYEGGLDIEPAAFVYTKKGDGGAAPDDWRVVSQKQDGLWAVRYHPFGGYLQTARLEAICELAKDSQDAEIRLDPFGGLYVINLASTELQPMLDATADGAQNEFESSVACVGHKRCDIGIAESQDLLGSVVEAVRKKGIKPDVLPRMNISGCPSTCGDSALGKIGWRGMRKKTPDGPRDAFAFMCGGCATLGHERLAKEQCVILADRIPDFLVELALRLEGADTTFDEWFPTHEEDLIDLAKSYAM